MFSLLLSFFPFTLAGGVIYKYAKASKRLGSVSSQCAIYSIKMFPCAAVAWGSYQLWMAEQGPRYHRHRAPSLISTTYIYAKSETAGKSDILVV